MSSASKTLELLRYFSPQYPEIGLSQLCKMAGRDKATTYRYLQSLEQMAFVEQDPVTKRYRLGPALLHLARTREVTVPRKAATELPLRALAAATGETAHVTVLSGKSLFHLSAVEAPEHTIRALITSQRFPFHATASGLCALAFGPAELLDYVAEDMQRFTPYTVTDMDSLRLEIDRTRRDGMYKSLSTYDIDACGFSAPLFDQMGLYAGSVSVASVASRVTPDLEQIIHESLPEASRAITRNWGGHIPHEVEQAWKKLRATASTDPPVP